MVGRDVGLKIGEDVWVVVRRNDDVCLDKFGRHDAEQTDACAELEDSCAGKKTKVCWGCARSFGRKDGALIALESDGVMVGNRQRSIAEPDVDVVGKVEGSRDGALLLFLGAVCIVQDGPLRFAVFYPGLSAS